MRGAIPPFPQYVFMTCCLVKHRDNFTFLPVICLWLKGSRRTFWKNLPHFAPPEKFAEWPPCIDLVCPLANFEPVDGASWNVKPLWQSVSWTHSKETVYNGRPSRRIRHYCARWRFQVEVFWVLTAVGYQRFGGPLQSKWMVLGKKEFRFRATLYIAPVRPSQSQPFARVNFTSCWLRDSVPLYSIPISMPFFTLPFTSTWRWRQQAVRKHRRHRIKHRYMHYDLHLLQTALKLFSHHLI
jgi:hypothetical protein